MIALDVQAPAALEIGTERAAEQYPTNDELEAVLTAAARAYARGKADYRDSMIETGLALQEYLEGRAALADGLTNHERVKRRYSREVVIREAAARLSMKPAKVTELVRFAMAAKLLSPGGECQCRKMSYMLLRPLSKYIQRSPGWVGTGTDKAARAGVQLISLAQRERWVIRAGYEDEARALFDRAADGDLSCKKLARLCKPSTKGPRRGHNTDPSIRKVLGAMTVEERHRERAALEVLDPDGDHAHTDESSRRPLDSVCVLARTCAPQDLVDMLLQLIAQARDRQVVVELLRKNLDGGAPAGTGRTRTGTPCTEGIRGAGP